MSVAAAGGREPGWREWAGFFAMIVGMFMAVLDIQIVSSSISEIQAGLAASADEAGWVQTSYLMAEVVMIPFSGFLSRALSTRWAFAVSAFGFTLSSALCALAWNLESMIVFRAIQGFLGGTMIPTVFAVIFSNFPPERRSGITVIVGLVATVAPTLGPTIGGWIADALSWHWLFLINIVPGILVTIAVALFADFDKPDLKLFKKLDLIGLVLMALFLGCLEWVLEEGTRLDWFGNDGIVVASIVSGIAGILFVWRSFTAVEPIVDLRAFADLNFALGCLFSFVIGIGLYGAVYVIPLYLAEIQGYKPAEIGKVMFVAGAFQFLSAPVAGRLIQVMEPRLMLALGLAMFGGGVWLQSGITAEWQFDELFLAQALRGFSLMFLFMPVNMAALGTLPPERLKNASGLYNLMRNLGGAIGLAVINVALAHRKAFHWSRIGDGLAQTKPEIRSYLGSLSERFAGTAGDGSAAALKSLGNAVQRQASVMAFADIAVLMAASFAAAIVLVPFLRVAKGPAPVEAH